MSLRTYLNRAARIKIDDSQLTQTFKEELQSSHDPSPAFSALVAPLVTNTTSNAGTNTFTKEDFNN